ncbi:chemotaxis protein CheB [Acidimicrobiaceae bacterium USS-CC1]|uniref:protein-glutamate methylesterase n=1 Tax=Acidiferrimicrobium australe TaxID=2664430 RepID=A0ABW9QU93_9ACTN|nr:chemotaxis protein CheB [Acidiferrimicrobium australe]
MADESTPAPAVVGLGASAGGVEALTSVVAGLPPSFEAAVLVVLHHSTTSYSALPAILTRAGPLPARHARDGERLVAGRVYVAPPGRHLVVEDGASRVLTGPRENGHRPSIDVLFRSVAASYGPAGAGVVLSGLLDDGTAGLAAIKQRGGRTVVQTPADAAFPDMPAAAIRGALPDAVCPAAEVYECLRGWLDAVLVSPPDGGEDDGDVDDPGEPELTEFTCPECGGALRRDERYGAWRFRCRVGHTYSATSLLTGKHDALETALWAAIVALEERRDLSRQVRDRLADQGSPPRGVARFEQDIADSERRAQLLRSVFDELVTDAPIGAPEDGDGDERAGR